jgi:transglutaminase-like putative cysteine protease
MSAAFFLAALSYFGLLKDSRFVAVLTAAGILYLIVWEYFGSALDYSLFLFSTIFLSIAFSYGAGAAVSASRLPEFGATGFAVCVCISIICVFISVLVFNDSYFIALIIIGMAIGLVVGYYALTLLISAPFAFADVLKINVTKIVVSSILYVYASAIIFTAFSLFASRKNSRAFFFALGAGMFGLLEYVKRPYSPALFFVYFSAWLFFAMTVRFEEKSEFKINNPFSDPPKYAAFLAAVVLGAIVTLTDVSNVFSKSYWNPVLAETKNPFTGTKKSESSRSNAELGGEIALSNKIVMRVTYEEGAKPVYIIEETLTEYDGSRWDSPEKIADRKNETKTFAANTDGTIQNEKNVEIEYVDISGLLIPERAYEYELNDKTLSAKIINFDSEPIPYGVTTTPEQKYFAESATERTRALALEITGPYDSPMEKAEALQNYFKDFPYTLKMEATPDGEDFVDYFLFNQRKGYCVYFASAMAVMARASGLASRYVAGYRHSGEAAPGNAGTFIIRQKNAHAWTEVFIDGLGWVRFEPTPGGFADAEEEALLEEEIPEETPENEVSEVAPPTATPPQSTQSQNNQNSAPNQNPNQKKKFEIKSEHIKTAALVLLFAAFCFTAYKMFRLANKRIKLDAKNWNRETMIKAYKYFLTKLAPRNPIETPIAYGIRIDAEKNVGMAECGAIFSHCVLTGDDVSEKERNIFVETMKKINKDS